jgi:thiamine kinase-like enzyme
MDSTRQSLNFFSFISESHPFFARVESLRRVLRESPRYSELLTRGGEAGSTVHAEIKGVETAQGAWRLDRFYWCFQYREPGGPVPFRSHTLYFRDDRGTPEFYDFPEDAYLGSMAGWFGHLAQGGEHAPRVDVLRYVPLRRVTFRIATPGAAPVIGKFKRRSKLQESYERLAAVHEAARSAGAGFRVAAPGFLDEEACIFYQEALPGRDLVETVDRTNFEALLERLGKVHQQMNALDVPGLPQWRFANYQATLRGDLRWISFFLPEQGALLDSIWERLERSPPDMSDDTTAFCHGDFVPSQALADGERWAITDFDMSRRGGATLEMAKLIGSFKYHVPLVQQGFERPGGCDEDLMDAAEAAYLRGYERAAGHAIDRARLLWFRISSEIHYLSLMLKKDTYAPETFDRALALVQRLAGKLAGKGTAS